MFPWITKPPINTPEANTADPRDTKLSPHWKWDNSVEVRSKKCKGCGKSMYLDVASAILYQNENWHLHCLMDMLTEYHQKGSINLQAELIKEWGNAP